MAIDVLALGIMIAVSSGSAGFVLALLTWLHFRGSPFGRAIAIVVVFNAVFTIYHASLLFWEGLSIYVLGVETFAFLLVLVFMAEMVRLHFKHLRVSGTQRTQT